MYLNSTPKPKPRNVLYMCEPGILSTRVAAVFIVRVGLARPSTPLCSEHATRLVAFSGRAGAVTRQRRARALLCDTWHWAAGRCNTHMNMSMYKLHTSYKLFGRAPVQGYVTH